MDLDGVFLQLGVPIQPPKYFCVSSFQTSYSTLPPSHHRYLSIYPFGEPSTKIFKSAGSNTHRFPDTFGNGAVQIRHQAGKQLSYAATDV